jgi:Ca2+:H+ antiporter
MTAKIRTYPAHWTVYVPIVAVATLILTWGRTSRRQW